MASTQTRNEIVTNEWKQISFDQISNPGQTTVEFWPGTIAPTATSKGHPMKPGQGLDKSQFEDAAITVRFRSTTMDAVLTVTEYI
jgi:hypothetical protein